MVFKLVFDLKKGATLVEIIVVIFIIALFSSILIANFPRIEKQFSLSRAAYKMAQDIRRAEDMGLSGVATQGAKGYGIYFDLSSPTSYILYADTCLSDSKYTIDVSCQKEGEDGHDVHVDDVELGYAQQGIYIAGIKAVKGGQETSVQYTSMNFSPPNPTVAIDNLNDGTSMEIILGVRSEPGLIKAISVNKSGLIEMK